MLHAVVLPRVLIVAIGLLLVASGSAMAQFDHLHCYKVEADHRLVAGVDLASAAPELPAQAGCRLKGPKLFCGPVAKTIVDAKPPAAGAPAGPEATSYLCYKARCQQAPGTFQASDQFATYTLRSRKSFLLCAPARLGTTTTTSSSTTTSPTTGPSTTTTVAPSCAGSAPSCGGTCPNGDVCVPISFGPSGSSCGCATPPVCAPSVPVCPAGNTGCPPGCFCFTGCLCVCA
jgi:hypothetical protein